MNNSKKKENADSNGRERKKLLKHRSLDTSRNLKTRFEEIQDISSYAHLCNKEELEFLIAFVEEYICANMNHKFEKLHETKEERKLCYDRNNARNRCVFTRQKAQGVNNMDYLEDIEKLKNQPFLGKRGKYSILEVTSHSYLEELVDTLMYLREQEENKDN